MHKLVSSTKRYIHIEEIKGIQGPTIELLRGGKQYSDIIEETQDEQTTFRKYSNPNNSIVGEIPASDNSELDSFFSMLLDSNKADKWSRIQDIKDDLLGLLDVVHERKLTDSQLISLLENHLYVLTIYYKENREKEEEERRLAKEKLDNTSMRFDYYNKPPTVEELYEDMEVIDSSLDNIKINNTEESIQNVVKEEVPL